MAVAHITPVEAGWCGGIWPRTKNSTEEMLEMRDPTTHPATQRPMVLSVMPGAGSGCMESKRSCLLTLLRIKPGMALFLNAVGVFLDDGVGQDLFSHALDFGAGAFRGEAASQF